ncbi:hypothetical protein GXP67_14815 [Rhodocytophaga rosea]|uniref:Uncharacterized protein n=1 Tax=Rhodocytophaga rosea TaxID=2704465 RepID=A0A6C0GIJ7_9BACT|nr:hypothetical protein [Rhodocytophaga rosea]QHT67818.1 hypothetical protein GXP67_14815 [Rhodocytophaga rosea]
MQSPDSTNHAQNSVQAIEKLTIQFEDAIQLDSSSYVMFPLLMNEKANEENFIDSRTYKDTDRLGYWNIIFYNTETDTFHLLDEKKKMLIHTFDMNEKVYREYEAVFHKQYIFYTITSFDSNGDKILNEKDFIYLYVSDRAGKKFRQLSPSNYHLSSWKVMKGHDKIVMLVSKDSNNNKKIDALDEVIPFVASIKDTLPARELFDAKEKNDIKKLFDRDWKRIK